MTELEIMLHAKKYIDKMANGIDPLTDQPVSEGDLINNVRISRCLFYVSGVLADVIEHGVAQKKPQRERRSETRPTPFSISEEALGRFPYSEQPLPITEIVRRINALVGDENMKPLTFRPLTVWLTNEGYLESRINDFGKPTKRPTEAGEQIGILTVERQGQSGPYTATVYDLPAQRFIIDNLMTILNS